MSTVFEYLSSALSTAQGGQLDAIGRTLWAHHAAGALTDQEAQALAESIQLARRVGVPRALGAVARRIARGSAPRRPEHLARRRELVASGWLPPKVAAKLTPSHAAVMAVIARECFERLRCKLCNAALANIAGVSVSTVKAAKRAAVEAGLIVVFERRVARDRSLTTVIKIASPEWGTWLAHRAARKGGGGKFAATSVQARVERKAQLPHGSVVRRFSVPLRQPALPLPMAQGAFGEGMRSQSSA